MGKEFSSVLINSVGVAMSIGLAYQLGMIFEEKTNKKEKSR